MAEAKRIELTTVGTLKKDRKPKEDSPTYRFQLTLGESNEKTCPEYSYLHLLKTVRGEANNGTVTAASTTPSETADPFADEDENENEKLKLMARKFEEKYSPKPGKKSWQKFGRLEDYIDLGMGYDETDPFIDNSDAYDELVPSTLTTQYGGFYINSGKLDFKEVQSDSSEDDPMDPNRKRKKRRLKDLDKDVIRRKKKFIKDGRDGEHLPKKRGRKPLDKPEGGKKQPTVAILLQHHKAQQQQLQQQPSPQLPSRTTVSPTPPQQLRLPSQPTHQTPVLGADLPVAASLGNLGTVIKKVEDAAEILAGAVLERELAGSGELQINTSSSDSDNAMFIPETEGAPKLPEGLSEHFEEAIKQIKAAALKSVNGKCKFFSYEVNNTLLNIELMSKELSCSQRSTVYAHLASHLPCTKETLLKRAKKLRLDQEDGKLREPMRRLKHAIDEVMPVLEETYKARCLVAAEGGLKVLESGHSDGDEDTTELEQCEEDDDYERSSEDEKTEGDVKVIRKKFEWSDKTRKLLCEVVQMKIKCFEVSKTRTQSADEYLRQFLKMEVKHLWPKGWMSLRKLIKESRLVHAHLTHKAKKNSVIVKKYIPTSTVQSLGNAGLDLQSPSLSLEPVHGTSLLKVIPVSSLPSTSSVISTPTAAAADCTIVRTTTVPSTSSVVLSQVSITPTNTSPMVKDPDPPSIVLTPITLVTTKTSAVTSTSLSTAHQTVLSSTSSSSFQASKPPASVLDSPNKLSSRSYKSLFDATAVTAMRSNDSSNVHKVSSSVSSAKDFLSEIINKSLADYSNSDKLSSSGYKYRDSPKFTSVLGKCSLTMSNHKSSPDLCSEVKAGFSLPKSVVQKMQASSSKGDHHSGGALVTSAVTKDSDRQPSQERRIINLPQDLRTQARTSSGLSSSVSSQRVKSPLKLDMLVSECLPLTGKLGSTPPFHSLYDIQGAIERGLQGQASPPISILSSVSANAVKTKSRSVAPSQTNYYPTASLDQPLNFSTTRQSVSVDKITGHTLARNTTPPQISTSTSQDNRARVSSPASTTTPSVRLVNLPQHQSNKFGSSTGSVSRSVVQQDPVYLEGIAASWQDFHLKKSLRAMNHSSAVSKSGSPRSELSANSPPSSHVSSSLTNHTLPKVSNFNTESIHSMAQGCTEVRLHRPRFDRPPTVQGNNTSP